MKPLRRPLLAVLAALLCCAPAAAPAQSIRAVTENTPYTRPQDGHVVGSGADLVAAVLKRAGLTDYRIELYPWARAYDMALRAPNVLLFLIAHTPEREGLFKWVGDVLMVKYQIYKLRERADIQPTSAAQLANYSIGVKRDDLLQKRYPTSAFPKVVVSANDFDTFHKLLGGQVELMPLPSADVHALCRRAHVDCHDLETVPSFGTAAEVPMGLAFSRQTPDDVVSRAREAFTRLRAESALPAMVPMQLPPSD